MSMTDRLSSITADDNDYELAPPAEYPDGGLDVIPAGWYDFVLTKYARYAGTSTDPRQPKGLDFELTVVGAQDDRFLGRRTGRIRQWTKKYKRNGVFVSALGDFIRGITDTEQFHDIEGAEKILDRAIDRAIPIQIRVDWEAFDKPGFDALAGDSLPDEEKKALRNRLTVKGMANFPKWEDGSPKSTVSGAESGDELNAQLRIRNVNRQSKRKDLKFRAA